MSTQAMWTVALGTVIYLLLAPTVRRFGLAI
jgi:hypothetical protein